MEPSSAVPAPDSTPSTPPACSICGRQDETLRIVGYPFVFSLLIVTYRRVMAGVWCRSHRNQRLVLSSLITATIGWLGIPFGFVYTPATLFKLARGGILPEKENAEMLAQIAAAKLQRGDYQSALRCLEASLRFQDSDAVHRQLIQIRSRYGLTVEGTGCIGTVLTFLAVLLGAGAIGASVGLVDMLITAAMSPLAKQAVPLYVTILTWVPFVVFAFLGGLILFGLVEWAIVRIRCKSAPIAVVLGLLSACFATYGLLEGEAIGYFTAELVGGIAFKSASEAIVVGLLTFTIGGAAMLSEYVPPAILSETVFVVLIAVIALYYVGFAIARALEAARCQERIVALPKTLASQPRPAVT